MSAGCGPAPACQSELKLDGVVCVSPSQSSHSVAKCWDLIQRKFYIRTTYRLPTCSPPTLSGLKFCQGLWGKPFPGGDSAQEQALLIAPSDQR